MTTFNVAAAPKAPVYLTSCTGMEVCLGYISFHFDNEDAKNQMLADLAGDKSLDKVEINEVKIGNPIDVHYGEPQRNEIKEIAHAISEAYGIPLL